MSERLNHGNFWRFRRLKHRRLNDGFAASFTSEPLCPLAPGCRRAAGPDFRPVRFTPPTLEAQGETPPAPARPTGLTATAGHHSVTLSWDDPNDSSITYEYRVNHNDTGTGKLTGWGQWQSIANTTSHTISGLTAGKEYRFKIRAVNLGGTSKPAPAAAPWYVKATPIDPAPPPVADLWTVRVCDDLFKVRWNFVPGATGYDMDMSGNNRQSWQRKMTNKNVNAWQFSQWTKNATFWFRVRTVNSHGASDWRYVKSIAPPCRVEGLQANRIPIDGQSGTITASWDAAKRASGYDVNFTADNGRSWQLMVTDLRATSYTFTKLIPYNSNYRIAVQSRRKGVTSGWSNAPIAGLMVSKITGTSATLTLNGYSGNWYYRGSEPPDDTGCKGPVSGAVKELTNLTAGTDYQYTAYSDSSCTDTISSVTFATPVTLTVSNVSNTSATLNIAGHDLQWWYDADTGPDSTCQGPVAANDSDEDLTGLTEHQQYTYKAYNASGCNAGDLLASITFEPSGDVLKVENVTATTAVLKIENHTDQWWYQANTAPDNSCQGPVTAGTTTVDLALIPGTEYTYKSYDVSGCGATHETASVDFTTLGVSVSNLEESQTHLCRLGAYRNFNARTQCGAVFETGNATNGYTLHSVTLKFLSQDGTPGNFNIALYETSGDYPTGSAIPNATLSGSAPRTAGDYTYTCSGAGCDLRKETKYVVVMSSPDSSNDDINQYQWRLTSSSNETLYPSNNGWSIPAKAVGRQGGNWYKADAAGMVKVAATVK